jgi:hypothetical protein
METPAAGISGPVNNHKIAAQISGITPNPKKTGVYEKWSTAHPVMSVNTIPPNPDPMLASP